MAQSFDSGGQGGTALGLGYADRRLNEPTGTSDSNDVGDDGYDRPLYSNNELDADFDHADGAPASEYYDSDAEDHAAYEEPARSDTREMNGAVSQPTRKVTLDPITTSDTSAPPAGSDSAAQEDAKFRKLLTRLMSDGAAQDDDSDKDSEKATIAWMNDAAVESVMLNTVPEVRKCNFEDFKNRYSATERISAVEVLMECQDMDAEMGDEQLRRLSGNDKKEYERRPRRPRQRKPNKKPEHTIRMERIRINSAYVLYYLSKASGQPLSHVPHTFLKPFEYLTHFHAQMETEYDSLVKKFGRRASQTVSSAVELREETTTQPETAEDPPVVKLARTATNAFSIPRNEPPPTPGSSATFQGFHSMDAANDEKAFHDMRRYMEAMKPVMTWYDFFQDKDYTNAPKIHYDDVPALFRVGDLLYWPGKVKATNKSSAGAEAGNKTSTGSESDNKTAGAKIHRLYSTSTESRDWIVHDLENDDGDLRGEVDVAGQDVKTYSYHIDYDGTDYRAAVSTITINSWEGEKEITKLPAYPLRFAKDAEQLLKDCTERGRRFRDLILERHKPLRLSGWTITHDHYGEALEIAPDKPIKHPQYIESDAIIDFAEAFQTYPWWKPVFAEFTALSDPIPDWEPDKFAFIYWQDKERSEAETKLPEAVFDHRWAIEQWRLQEFTKTEKLLFSPEERGDAELELRDVDLALLPLRMLVYCLRERKFANVKVEDIKPLRQGHDPFRDLQINPDHKLVIRAVMDQHFKRKDMVREGERQNKQITSQQDIIQGKGRGLVLLLHGAPGVGKTATAECIAQELQKPLLLITSGDMGLDAEDVEWNLSNTFRLADRWDCVLLMDEADIFLSAREQKDSSLQRNALVSVFLRTLEYYPGVLFLTTNRPGVLDEAVKSRVHMIFKYPALGWAETMEVFRLNLRMLKRMEQDGADVLGTEMMDVRDGEIEQFAYGHFAEKPKQRWNGRQIRNAFQIARSLAHFEYESNKSRGDPDAKLYIGARHFRTVAEATMAFDEYKQITIGKSDDEHAASRMERARERDAGPGRADSGTPSWRSNYGDGLYAPRPRTPQPNTQYSYQNPYSAPPAQHTPSPNPSFSLGGALNGTGMTPTPYGYSQDSAAAPSYPPYQQQQQQQQHQSSRPPMSSQYSDSPGTMHDLKQAPPQPSASTPQGYPSVPAPDQHRQGLPPPGGAAAPQSYAGPPRSEPMRYGDEAQRYGGSIPYRPGDSGRPGGERAY